jgi:hypothetical protein
VVRREEGGIDAGQGNEVAREFYNFSHRRNIDSKPTGARQTAGSGLL